MIECEVEMGFDFDFSVFIGDHKFHLIRPQVLAFVTVFFSKFEAYEQN